MNEYKKNCEQIKHDINKEFSKMMQEACNIYWEAEYHDILDNKEFIDDLLRKRKYIRNKRILQSVAVVLMILLTGVYASVWFHADNSYAEKRLSEKHISVISPQNLNEKTDGENSDTEIITVKDEEGMRWSKKDMGEIHIARYIPEGYDMDQLIVTTMSGYKSAEYTYSKKNNILYLCLEYYNETADITVVGNVYISPITNQKMYIKTIDDTDGYTISCYEETYDCYIRGMGDIKEGIKVMESLELY